MTPRQGQCSISHVGTLSVDSTVECLFSITPLALAARRSGASPSASVSTSPAYSHTGCRDRHIMNNPSAVSGDGYCEVRGECSTLRAIS